MSGWFVNSLTVPFDSDSSVSIKTGWLALDVSTSFLLSPIVTLFADRKSKAISLELTTAEHPDNKIPIDRIISFIRIEYIPSHCASFALQQGCPDTCTAVLICPPGNQRCFVFLLETVEDIFYMALLLFFVDLLHLPHDPVHCRCLRPLGRLELAESLHQLADQTRGFCLVHLDPSPLKSPGQNGLLVLRRDDLDPLLGELFLVTGKEHRLQPYGTARGREFVRLSLCDMIILIHGVRQKQGHRSVRGDRKDINVAVAVRLIEDLCLFPFFQNALRKGHLQGYALAFFRIYP